MSYFGRWECPKCGNEWTGSIGWNLPNTEYEMNDLLERICDCTNKKITDEQMVKAVTMSNLGDLKITVFGDKPKKKKEPKPKNVYQ